jgi:hypothetical protein
MLLISVICEELLTTLKDAYMRITSFQQKSTSCFGSW